MSISPVKIAKSLKTGVKNTVKKCNPSKILKKAKATDATKGVVKKVLPTRFDPVQILAGVLLGATGIGVPSAVVASSYANTTNQQASTQGSRVYSTTA